MGKQTTDVANDLGWGLRDEIKKPLSSFTKEGREKMGYTKDVLDDLARYYRGHPTLIDAF